MLSFRIFNVIFNFNYKIIVNDFLADIGWPPVPLCEQVRKKDKLFCVNHVNHMGIIAGIKMILISNI